MLGADLDLDRRQSIALAVFQIKLQNQHTVIILDIQTLEHLVLRLDRNIGLTRSLLVDDTEQAVCVDGRDCAYIVGLGLVVIVIATGSCVQSTC